MERVHLNTDRDSYGCSLGCRSENAEPREGEEFPAECGVDRLKAGPRLLAAGPIEQVKEILLSR
jgi:hypothetical protein